MAGKFTCQPIKNQIEYLKLPKKKLGKGEVKRKEVIGRNQTHNFDFFNVIDTEKAYALGLWITDGHLTSRDYQVGFTNKELALVELWRDLLGSEHKIYKKPNDVYTIAGSKRLHKSLTEKGFDVEKSNSAFYPQNIPSHLNSHFIRGLFDGDGCITRYFRKKDGVPVVSVYIAGTYSLLTEVNQRIPEPVPSLPKDKGKKSSHRLILSSQKAKKFLEWIYQDSNGLRLDRKYQRYIDCLNKEGIFSLDSRKA